MRRIIVLKARVADLAQARAIATRLSGAPAELLEQVDTYFQSTAGRLKLREIAGQPSQLIWYARSNSIQPRPSDYELVPVADAARLKRALESALGIRVVVAKTRELFLYDNVRIHLDQVSRLGAFIEFEAVLGAADKSSVGEQQVNWLAQAFELRPDQIVAESYSDLLLEHAS